MAASSCSSARHLACRPFELGSRVLSHHESSALGLPAWTARSAGLPSERQGAAGADEVGDLVGREDLAMDPHVADPDVVEPGAGVPLADLERDRRPDRVVQLIGRDVGGLRFAVDVDLDARGLRRAVVGDEHMGPRVQRDLAAGDHLEGILRPLVDEVGCRPCCSRSRGPSPGNRADRPSGR